MAPLYSSKGWTLIELASWETMQNCCMRFLLKDCAAIIETAARHLGDHLSGLYVFGSDKVPEPCLTTLAKHAEIILDCRLTAMLGALREPRG